MRKKLDYFIFAFARFGLMLSFIFSLIAAFAAIIVVSVGLKGGIKFNESGSISLTQFDRGIPFHATINTEIPDSSMLHKWDRGSSFKNYFAGHPIKEQLTSDSLTYSDKIMSDFQLTGAWGDPTDIKISGGQLKTAVFYLQPEKLWHRLWLSLPGILTLLLIPFCCWQLLQFVRAIHSGNSFSQMSAKRLAKIGWAILFINVLFFILDLLQQRVASSILIDFHSTIPNFRMPFHVQAFKEGYFSLGWLFGSAIILLVAKAFKYGNQLQKYEDSTI